MKMKPSLRKFVLTAHITFSVGWLGAVAGFLILALAGLFSQNAQTARAAYIAMDLIGWFVIVPCSLATLVIGLIQSLGTKWGLFRHYWILIKLLLTVGATFLLILHMQATSRIANAAAEMSLSNLDFRPLRIRLAADAVAALLVLIAATVLSVYKPWGLTAYGQRRQREQSSGLESKNDIFAETDGELKSDTPWGLYFVIGLGVLALIFVAVHLAGGGLGQHEH
ncbi:MAG: hypothetical protein ACR2HG_08205 [Pyrinomonadaceae bacterium]